MYGIINLMYACACVLHDVVNTFVCVRLVGAAGNALVPLEEERVM